jgi:hypothetical protein
MSRARRLRRGGAEKAGKDRHAQTASGIDCGQQKGLRRYIKKGPVACLPLSTRDLPELSGRDGLLPVIGKRCNWLAPFCASPFLGPLGALSADALQELSCRLVVRVLGDKFATKDLGEDGLVKFG